MTTSGSAFTHPVPGTTPVVGIIGGHGQMGSWFGRFFSTHGCTVLESDRDTLLSNADVATRADLLIVSVPLRHTPTALAEVVPLTRPDCLIVDVASLMIPSYSLLLGAPGDACALHPLFGPTTPTLAMQTLVLSPVKNAHDGDGGWLAWLVDLLTLEGAVLRRMEPAAHDAAMAAVQALLHASFVAFAAALPATGIAITDALALATPTMRLYLALVARILNQPADLYADLLTINTAAPAALAALCREMEAVHTVVRSGDVTACQSLFEQARDALGTAGAALIPEAEQALHNLHP